MTFRRMLPLAALLLVLLLHSTAAACPTCSEGLMHDANSQQLMQGYFWSIVFMMSMPFLILGSLSTYFYILIRQARSQQAAALVCGGATTLT